MVEQVDTMEEIELDPYWPVKSDFPAIRAPRFHDNTLIIQAKVDVHNKLVCTYVRADGTRMFPDPLYISGFKAKQFKPFWMLTAKGGRIRVRAIPIGAFKRMKRSERSIYA